MFEAVDLLLFVLSGINVSALAIFTFKHWEVYKLSNKKRRLLLNKENCCIIKWKNLILKDLGIKL